MYSFPFVAEFNVPKANLLYQDVRSVSRAEGSVVTTAMYDLLQNRLCDAVRPGMMVCGGMSDAAMLANGTDPDLPAVVLIGKSRDGAIRGGFTLYNMQLANPDAQIIEVIATPAPHVYGEDRISIEDAWAESMEYILEKNLPLEDGRELDVVEWDYSDVLPGHRWENDDDATHPGRDPEMASIGGNVIRRISPGRDIVKGHDGETTHIRRRRGGN